MVSIVMLERFYIGERVVIGGWNVYWCINFEFFVICYYVIDKFYILDLENYWKSIFVKDNDNNIIWWVFFYEKNIFLYVIKEY